MLSVLCVRQKMEIWRECNMKIGYIKKLISFISCIMLIMTVAFFTTGCNSSKEATNSSTSFSSSSEVEVSAEPNSSEQSGVKQLGEGKRKFTFTVVDADSSETQFEISTDAKTIGDALSSLGLIEGEESTYGLYVKTVDGITHDYNEDGMYWALYINGEYAQTGVDSTEIKEGESYSFKAEKG